MLTAQYRPQRDGEGSPGQHERRRLERRRAALEGEAERLLEAYQSGVIELSDLKDRRERIKAERAKLAERLAALRQRQYERERQAAFAATLKEFCRTMSEALTDPSCSTKQKILRLVVGRVEFKDDEITIKHLIPVPTVRLQRHQLGNETPLWICRGRWRLRLISA